MGLRLKQTIVLVVEYDEDDGQPYQPPNEWDWADLAGVDVECIAAGPVINLGIV